MRRLRVVVPSLALLGAACTAAAGDLGGEGPLHPVADSVSAGAGDAVPARWGFRDASGRTVVPPRYAYAATMSGGRAPVAIRDEWALRWGYVAASGAEVIAPRYDGAGRFADGRAIVLLGEDFLVIDSTGAVVAQLAGGGAAVPTPPDLPAPCDSCTLEAYIQTLPRVGAEDTLYVHPVIGESYLRIVVQRHPGDILSVAEGGWEHQGHDLRIPGLTLEAGVALAKRIMGAGQYVERHDSDAPDAVVLEGTGVRLGAGVDEMRIRRRNGVVEISHFSGV